MKRGWSATLAVALAGAPVAAQVAESPGEEQAQATARADAAARDRVMQVVANSGFAGTFALYQGPRRIAGGSAGPAVPNEPGGFTYQQVWPWGGVTGQVVATLAMQEVDAGRIALDAPASRYLPGLRMGAPTVRQLVRQQPGAVGPVTLNQCMVQVRAPGCDTVLLGAIVQRTARAPLPQLFEQRIAARLGLSAGFVGPMEGARPDVRWPGGPTAAEQQGLADRGALAGTPVDLVTFDRGLLSGALLSGAARDQLWSGAYTAPLAGCPGPVTVVERRSVYGRFAVANVILPAQGVSLVLFSNRGDQADLGEVRQGRGLAHDMLAAAVCA